MLSVLNSILGGIFLCQKADAFVTVAAVTSATLRWGKAPCGHEGRSRCASLPPVFTQGVRSSVSCSGTSSSGCPLAAELPLGDTQEVAPSAVCSQSRAGFGTTAAGEVLGLFVLSRTPGTGLAHPLLAPGGLGAIEDLLGGAEVCVNSA